MLSKNDLQSLATMRLADAEHLFKGMRYSAAYYLSGYAVELGIKACIAGSFHANVIPDKSYVNAVYSHKLDELLGLSGLKQKFQLDIENDHHLAAAWGVVSKWNEVSRYKIWDQFSASSMIESVNDEQHGVLQWLKRYW